MYNKCMGRNTRVFIPSTSDIKIMFTIQKLNSENLYPTSHGVYKILSGSMEDEYINYREYETFATLLSYSSKHVSRLIMMLLRNKYIERIYDEKTNELYLKIGIKGEMFLLDYSKKHKYSFTKKENNKKPTIVKIEK